MTSWLNNFLLFTLLLLPTTVGAAGYVELVGVPGLADASDITINEYVNALYRLAIGIAGLLAVLRLIMAGAKYILSDVVTTKESAKKDIFTSILGLVIVISAVLILQTVNRDLTDFNILSNLETASTTLTYTPRTVCEIDSGSAECCLSSGGTFSETVSGSSCSQGAVIPVPLTGDEDVDRVNCETSSGLVWDEASNVCRDEGDEIRDFPRPLEDEGLDVDNPEDIGFLRLLCAEWGNGWEYNEDLKQCFRDGSTPDVLGSGGV